MKQAYGAGNYQKALEIAEKMHELKSGDAYTMYNMARMHCLLGHKDKTYEWLGKAIGAGFSNADKMANDDALAAVRADKRFRALVKQLRQEARKRAEQK